MTDTKRKSRARDEEEDPLALKPCPHCGGAAKFGVVPDDDQQNFGGEFIECQECGASTCLMFPVMDEVKTHLAEKWNRRVK